MPGQPSLVRDAVVQFLSERDWTYEEHESFLALEVVAGNGEWPLLCYFPSGTEQLVVHSLVPVDIPDEQVANVVEFVTRANFGLAVGNFEIDLTEGPGYAEVRFKTSLDAEGSSLAVPAVRNLVDANLYVLDRYLPGLVEAARGRPAAACIAEIEGSDAN